MEDNNASFNTNTSGPATSLHQVDESKGGCQLCGIDSGTIARYNVACPGKVNLPGGVESNKVDMAAIQEKYNRKFEPLVVPNAPKPFVWKPGMTNEDLAPLDKLLEAKFIIDAKIAARQPDPKLPPPTKIQALPPRIVE